MTPEHHREIARTYLRTCLVFSFCTGLHLFAAYAAWRAEKGTVSMAAHLVTAGGMAIIALLQLKLRRIWADFHKRIQMLSERIAEPLQ